MKKNVETKKINFDKEIYLHNVYVYTKNNYKELCLVETCIKKDYYCKPYIAGRKFSFDTLQITNFDLSNDEFDMYFKKSFGLPDYVCANFSKEDDFLSKTEKLTVMELINLQKELNQSYNNKILTNIDDIFIL